MTVAEQIVEKIRRLAPERQREVLHFVETLQEEEAEKLPLRSLRGLWKGYGVQVTEKDIEEARREMWGNFPKPFPS